MGFSRSVDQRNPCILNRSLTTQYKLSSQYLLEITYHASAGAAFTERWQANTPPIDYVNPYTLSASAVVTPQPLTIPVLNQPQ